MKSKNRISFFSSLLTFIMIFTLLTPAFASANSGSIPSKSSIPNESTMQMKAAIAEQDQLRNQLPALHKDLQKEKGQHDVEVIIHLSEDPIALTEGKKSLKQLPFNASERAKEQQKINAQQKAVKNAMKTHKLLVKEGFAYETVLNGFSATVKADDLEKLLEIKGVTLVEPVVEVHAYEDSSENAGGEVSPMMDTSHSFLGIERIWNKGIKGQGIKVGVLDTGIDYHHPEFEGIYKGGWNFIEHDDRYTSPRADDDPYETTPSERASGVPEFNANGSSFYTSHGTHVAGTIAALGNNEYGIAGLAPEVDLHAYRVLGAYGSGSNAGVIAGINKAVEEGMDIINLSLGGGNNSSTTADTIAINNAMMAGTVAVSATGNSGPNRGTIGTPAAAALGIAVGNTTNPETMYNINVSVQAGDLDLSKQLNLMSTTYGTDVTEQLSGEFELVPVPGVGNVGDFNGVDVDGKVALISRGEIAFVDKIANAKANGAVATIIHNFAGGSNAPDISNVFLGDDFEFLPTVDMSWTDGEAIRTALGGGNGTVSFSNVDSTTTEGDEVNNSSSRGPTTPHFDIKPDVSAPGTNIMSTIPMYGKEVPDADYSKAFTRKTGTSMATPHIAGIAALIMNANPDWNAFDVKVSLSNTAKILDTEKYDVFAQGPGRVQPYEAAYPNALAYAEDTVVSDGVEVDNPKGTVTFGHLPEIADGDVSLTKQVRVKNLSGESSEYNVSVEVTKSFGDANVTVDTSSFTLGDEQMLNFTLNASQAAAPAGSEILGYIHITDGVTELSLPFAADFSPAVEGKTGIENFELSGYDVSFHPDSTGDPLQLTFDLHNNVSINYIELWDFFDPDGGAYGDGYIGYLHAGDYLGAGSYYLDIDGQYAPWGGTGLEMIPDSVYTVDFTGLNADSHGDPIIFDWDGPLFVKSTQSEIESAEEHVATDSTYNFTGSVIDNYIDYSRNGFGYNVNTKLATTFEAKDADGNVVSSGPVNLAQNGSFAFDVTGLADGDNTVTIFVNDAAGNSAEASYVVSYEEVIVDPEPEDPEYVVSPGEIEDQIGGDSKEITIAVPAFDEAMNIEIDEAIVNTIVVSKMDVVVETGDGFSFNLARKVIKKLANGTDGTLTIALTKEASTGPNAISDVYSFNFETGDGAVIDIGKEKIDITIPVDVSDVKKTNKLTVLDLENNRTYNLKYKDGIATFKADGPGKFVAVD
ncbi:S8 family serine peptidase [Sporosarcina sp. Marseille-Q4063]|uniref:S8 family serine peptidase n=1 Tax=Sporosarcina sp. Marseille-Q4063 TaxID=2810514 RepID=UPI0020167AA8|nr:S8 family serine peptidase [Sporosarcina sp. Marseille-Q4063]